MLIRQDNPVDKTVSYNLNSHGYRCPEWENIDWANSHILLGCSVVQGVGLCEEDTLNRQLAKLLNDPVINLGVGGGSLPFILANTYKLIDAGIKPKSVILIEPEPSRIALFYKNRTEHIGTWVLWRGSGEHYDWYKTWVKDNNAEVYGYLAARSIKTAWQQLGVPFVGIGQPDCPGDEDLPRYVDVANDKQHPGPQTIKLWAEYIANKKARLSELLG
jgi:hypothetical protein